MGALPLSELSGDTPKPAGEKAVVLTPASTEGKQDGTVKPVADKPAEKPTAEPAKATVKTESTPEKDKQKEKSSFAEKVSKKVKDAVNSYLKNLDPRNKGGVWWLTTIGSAAGSAYLAINTGGASILAKSLITAAASAGFHALEKTYYKAQESDLKLKYKDEELKTKIAGMREKHAKGVNRVGQFFGGLAAGSLIGGLTGTAIDALSSQAINTALVDNSLQTAKDSAAAKLTASVENLKDTMSPTVEQAVTNAQETLAPVGEKLDVAVDKLLENTEVETGRIVALAQDNINAAQHTIDAIRENIAQAQDLVTNVGENIDKANDLVNNVQDQAQNPALSTSTIAAVSGGAMHMTGATRGATGILSGVTNFFRGFFSSK